MISVHRELAVALVLLTLCGTLWAGYAASKSRLSNRLRGFGWLTMLAVSAQAVLGAVLAIAGNRPADGLHFLFGPATLFALPIAMLGARSRPPRTAALILCAGWLLTLALSLRAAGSGGGLG
jgi:heme A synthase